MITYHEVKQRTPEWHALRSGKVTASRADKLLVRGIEAALEEEGNFSSFAAWRGLQLEEEAIELYEKIKGVEVMRVGFVTNDEFPIAGYSPDGILSDRILEVKCFYEARHLSEPDFKVLAQCHFGMMVADKPFCDLLFYNPDLDASKALIIVTLERDEAIVSNFKRKLSGVLGGVR